MKKLMKQFARDERGVTAIEYGLIAGLVAIGIVTALTNIGTNLTGVFGKVETALTTANAPAQTQTSGGTDTQTTTTTP